VVFEISVPAREVNPEGTRIPIVNAARRLGSRLTSPDKGPALTGRGCVIRAPDRNRSHARVRRHARGRLSRPPGQILQLEVADA
jgi:hypothetical protein